MHVYTRGDHTLTDKEASQQKNKHNTNCISKQHKNTLFRALRHDVDENIQQKKIFFEKCQDFRPDKIE